MSKLNKSAFNLLDKCSKKGNVSKKKENTTDWYELTYPVFLNTPLNNEEDFWKIVAYAHSWLITIPTIKKEEIGNINVLIADLQSLRNGNTDKLESLLKRMIPAINNSLIAVSKILHFIAPNSLPIIDRNVILGWNYFFEKLHPEYSIEKISKYPSSTKSKILLYLKYKKTLDEWVLNCGNKITLRELEEALFKIGQRQPKKEKNDLYNYAA